MTAWSNQVFFTRPKSDVRAGILELLQQDGFHERDLHLPELGSDAFLQLLKDAEAFTSEIATSPNSWPLRSGRWLNRISVGLTGKPLFQLPTTLRPGVTHAAVVLAGRPELLQ